MTDWSSLYPPNWAQLAESVKQRDGQRCQNCTAAGPVLHAHHIVPLSRGGSNATTNLVTLCEQCHSQIHPHMRRGIIAKSPGFWTPFPREAIPASNLSLDVQRLIADKPDVWEYRLLDCVIQEELAVTSTLWDIVGDDASRHPLSGALDYMALVQQQIGTVRLLLERIDSIMNEDLDDAMGPPGEPAEPNKLIQVGRDAAHVHRELVIWQCELESITPPGDAVRLHTLMAQIPGLMIQESERFFYSLHRAVVSEIPAALAAGRPISLDLSWSLAEFPLQEEVLSEIERITRGMRSEPVPTAVKASRGGGCLGSILVGISVLALAALVMKNV